MIGRVLAAVLGAVLFAILVPVVWVLLLPVPSGSFDGILLLVAIGLLLGGSLGALHPRAIGFLVQMFLEG